VSSNEIDSGNALCLASVTNNRIRFVPTQAGTASFNFYAWDQSASGAGNTGTAVAAWDGDYHVAADTTTTSPYSSANAVGSITVADGPSFVAGGDVTVGRNIGTACIAPWGAIAGVTAEATPVFTFTALDNPSNLISTTPTMNSVGDLFFTVKDGADGTSRWQVVMAVNGISGEPQTFAITVNATDAPTVTGTIAVTGAILNGTVTNGRIQNVQVNDTPASFDRANGTWLYDGDLIDGENPFIIEVTSPDAHPGTGTIIIEIEDNSTPAPAPAKG
jgi:hypothetical protein